MTRKDELHYSAKHPAGTTYDEQVAAAIKEKAVDGRITCADAFVVVQELSVPPSEVGKTIDLIEYRITRCQLGLFGYSPKKKVVEPAEEAPEGVRGQLNRFSSDGTISCAACWKIADTLGMERMAVSAVCELLGLKVQPCQLGAF
ncbi:MAG TPA: hypothetical protein VJP78_12135 [Thermoleophilia bacterium]|nr:hypothetical protein [Thermoleophilia bacterium]